MLAIGVTIAAIIAAGIYSYKTFVAPIKTHEIKDPTFSIYLENKKKVFEESSDWYETKITYPEQNERAANFVFTMWNDFARENQLKKYKNLAEAKKELGLNVDGAKYGFTADYKLVEGKTLTGSSTLAYVYTVYTFTGGAHGSTQIIAFTQDEFGKTIGIEEILPKVKLDKIAKLSYENLLKQRRERMKSFNMTDKEIAESLKDDSWLKEGTAPTRENYSVAWLDGNDIVISFGQYQIASYAEGIFEVRIPADEI